MPHPRDSWAATRSVALRAAVPLCATAERVLVAGLRRSSRRGDRGDVPGWVLVTLMTAGLVTALWVLARDRFTEVFDKAITSVTG